MIAETGTMKPLQAHPDLGETFCIGEGFKTCASLRMATGYDVVSAGEGATQDGCVLGNRHANPRRKPPRSARSNPCGGRS